MSITRGICRGKPQFLVLMVKSVRWKGEVVLFLTLTVILDRLISLITIVSDACVPFAEILMLEVNPDRFVSCTLRAPLVLVAQKCLFQLLYSYGFPFLNSPFVLLQTTQHNISFIPPRLLLPPDTLYTIHDQLNT